MTPELGPEARALLDAARQELGPDAEAVRRMRAGIESAAASGAAASVGASSMVMKLGGVVGVAVALVIGAIVYSQRGDPERVAAPVAIVAPAAVAPAPAPVAPAPVVQPEIEILPEPPEAKPMRRRSARSAVATPAATPEAPPPAAAPARGVDLAREVALVDRAMAALRRGDPDAALSAVRTHAAETRGAGQLAEDAAAIEIEALCRLRSTTVAAKLAAFDAAWPESAQRSRLTTRCP